jgi:hypothetical protein
MELSPEDALRLNVLLANAEAVRIDENNMTIYGLNDGQEMKFPLTPSGRSDQYLKLVRATLSAAVLDSPGGYPLFLRRWTRMGQIDHEQMDRLLRLGEPEAVMAVVCSRNLSDELARRAWWCAPWSEHARRMLESKQVVAGEMGKKLAAHLIEHLPFETEPRDMLDTVRLVLQPGLIDEEQKQRLWQSGARNRSYRIGFLETLPDALPEQQPPRADAEQYREVLSQLAVDGNPFAYQLQRLLSAAGQSFLTVAEDVLLHPADQEAAIALFNTIGSYFSQLPHTEGLLDIAAIEKQAERMLQENSQLRLLLKAIPVLESEIRAMLILSHVSEYLLNPVFSQTDAVGTVMQERMLPVTTPLQQSICRLRGKKATMVTKSRGRGRRVQ